MPVRRHSGSRFWSLSELDIRTSWQKVNDRTPSLVLSVVHTTEQHPRIRAGRVCSCIKADATSGDYPPPTAFALSSQYTWGLDMSIERMPDERLILFYEDIRRHVEADRAYKQQFMASPTVRDYADQLRSEMIKRRLNHSPIEWPY